MQAERQASARACYQAEGHHKSGERERKGEGEPATRLKSQPRRRHRWV